MNVWPTWVRYLGYLQAFAQNDILPRPLQLRDEDFPEAERIWNGCVACRSIRGFLMTMSITSATLCGISWNNGKGMAQDLESRFRTFRQRLWRPAPRRPGADR